MTIGLVRRRFVLACLLANLSSQGAGSQDAPNPAKQDEIVDRMHRYAARYVSGLPDFLCMQVTKQSEAGVKSNKYRKGDTLVSRLSFHEGRELRGLESVNGRPVGSGGRRSHSPLTTEGEFGMLLQQVLGEDTAAQFTWTGWEARSGKLLAVFDFAVDRQHSTLSLQLSDLARSVLPYHGSIYADPVSGAVWKISNLVTDIPAALKTKEFSTTIEYGEIAIGDRTYILPIQAEVDAVFSDKRVRNQMEFQNYRKFGSDTVVTFGPEK